MCDCPLLGLARERHPLQIHCNPLAVFGLQLVGNNLVLNVDHAGNHMLASTNCGLHGNVSDLPQILHSTNSVP